MHVRMYIRLYYVLSELIERQLPLAMASIQYKPSLSDPLDLGAEVIVYLVAGTLGVLLQAL